MRWLSNVVEPESTHNRTQFASSSRNAMAGGPEPGGVNLRRQDEGGGIWSKVGEEESQGVDDDEARMVVSFQMVERDCKRKHENGHEEEAL